MPGGCRRRERDPMTTALLVLDMLTDFTTGKLANPAAGQITEPIAALARAARDRDGWVVIYGNDAHQPGDFELAVFGEHAMAGTPGAQVIGALAPQDGDIIVPERYYSAFTQTDLDATCRVRRIDRLVITGQHTDCCCRHTSYGAFTLIAVADATAVYQPFTSGRYQQAQDDALRYLRTYYGAQITDTAALV
jgi:nicotinamidase-related amidase